MSEARLPHLFRCALCGVSQNETLRMIAREYGTDPRAAVCEGCVRRCVEILDDQGLDTAAFMSRPTRRDEAGMLVNAELHVGDR